MKLLQNTRNFSRWEFPDQELDILWCCSIIKHNNINKSINFNHKFGYFSVTNISPHWKQLFLNLDQQKEMPEKIWGCTRKPWSLVFIGFHPCKKFVKWIVSWCLACNPYCWSKVHYYIVRGSSDIRTYLIPPSSRAVFPNKLQVAIRMGNTNVLLAATICR